MNVMSPVEALAREFALLDNEGVICSISDQSGDERVRHPLFIHQ